MKQRAVVKCEASEGHSTAELDARCLLCSLFHFFEVRLENHLKALRCESGSGSVLKYGG